MPVKNIGVEKLKNWLTSDDAVVVDVREPGEYKSGHIKGAFNKPLSTVDVAEVNMPEHNHKNLVLHCLSGKRSMMAAEKLMAEDPNLEVFNLDGGITAWQDAGEPTISKGIKILPLDRQMQLTAGSLAFFGTLLGWLVAPGFYIIPAFVGAGLMVAGLTGWCGMMKLLAKMPWNKG